MTDRNPDEFAPHGRPSRYEDMRDDYDDEFGRDRTPLWLARHKVMGPAVAFVVIGTVGMLGMGVAVVAFRATQWNLRSPMGIILWLLLLGLAAGLFAVVVAAGVHLHRLRRRWLALAGAYIVTSLALAGPYGLPFFPFGIWALVVLYQPDVREQFRRPPGARPPEDDR